MRSRAIRILVWLPFIMIAAGEVKSSPPPSNAYINDLLNNAGELLDSYSGQTDILVKAKNILEDVRMLAPTNPQMLFLFARYTLVDGYLGVKPVPMTTGSPSGETRMVYVSEYKQNSIERADAYVLHSIESDKAYPDAYALRAHIEMLEAEHRVTVIEGELKRKKLHDAQIDLRKAEALGAKGPWVQIYWAQYFSIEDDMKRARTSFDGILNNAPKDKKLLGAAYDYLIAYNENHENYGEVDRLYRKEFEIFPKIAWLRSNYADYLRNVEGEYDLALRYATEALHIDDDEYGKSVYARCLYAKWADLLINGSNQAEQVQAYFELAQKAEPNVASVMSEEAYFTNQMLIVKALENRGVSIDATDDKGLTNLFTAVTAGRAEVVKELLGLGADPNRILRNGYTPLLASIDLGYSKIAEILLKSGADPTYTMNGIDDALGVARSRKNQKMIDLIKPYLDKAKEKRLEKKPATGPSAVRHAI